MKNNLQPEFVQLSVLPKIFGVSQNYFEMRKKSNVFKRGVHYFVPEEHSRTKHIVLWDLDALRNWFRGNPSARNDTELEELINR